MFEYFKHNIIYPPKANKKNQQEKIFVKFMVEANGKVCNVQVKESKYPLLAKEAERVVKMMPNWSAAKYHNVPTKAYLQVPINFKLED